MVNEAATKATYHPRARGIGYALALLAAALWALSDSLAKPLFTPQLDPLSLAQTRSLVGFVLLWPALFLLHRPMVRVRRRDLLPMAAVGVCMVLMHGCYYYAISKMYVAAAIVVQYLAPILILLYVRCFTSKPVGAAMWAAAVLCLAGCALVAGLPENMGQVSVIGLAAALASAVAYAVYVLVEEGADHDQSPWTTLCYGFGFATVFWCVWRPWWNFPVEVLSARTGALIGSIAVCGTVLPFGMLALALRYIPAGPAGIATSAEPLFAAIFAYLFLGERLTLLQMFGEALVLAGIVLARRATPPPAEAQAIAPGRPVENGCEKAG